MTDAVKVNVLLTENMMELEKQLLTGKIVLTWLGLLTVIGKWLLHVKLVLYIYGVYAVTVPK